MPTTPVRVALGLDLGEALAADAVVAQVRLTLLVISSAWRRIARRRLAILASCCSVTRSPLWLETRSVNHLRQF